MNNLDVLSQNDLAYPVLMIGDDYFSIHRKADSLTRCTDSALERNVYGKALYIDAHGRKLRVASVERVGFAPPFFGFRLMTGRQITVSLKFSCSGNLTLVEVTEVLRNVIKSTNWGADPDFFEKVSTSAKNIEELFVAIDQ